MKTAEVLVKPNSVNPGFDPDKVWCRTGAAKNKYPDTSRQTIFFQQLLEPIEASPGVESAGGTTCH